MRLRLEFASAVVPTVREGGGVWPHDTTPHLQRCLIALPDTAATVGDFVGSLCDDECFGIDIAPGGLSLRSDRQPIGHRLLQMAPCMRGRLRVCVVSLR